MVEIDCTCYGGDVQFTCYGGDMQAVPLMVEINRLDLLWWRCAICTSYDRVM